MQVIDRLLQLREREHESTLGIVEALLECHHTKAHVDLGYANLWVFMIEYLSYSKGAASRRLRAVRCAARFPVVLQWLRERRVNLAALSKAAALLDHVADADELLARIEGRTEDEVEHEVARTRPMEQPREQVKTVFVQPRANKEGAVLALAFEEASVEVEAAKGAEVPAEVEGPASEALTAPTSLTPPTSVAPSPPPPPPPPAAPEPRVALQFSFTPEEFAAFERARAILSRKFGRAPSLEESFTELVGFFLAKKAPKVRVEREVGSAGNQSSEAGADEALTPAEGEAPTHDANEAPNYAEPEVPQRQTATQRSRHIPVAVRDQVLLRDGERCTYTGPDGHRCSATVDLEVDHIEPYSFGGPNTLDNLRVLCASHNRRRGELTFGPPG